MQFINNLIFASRRFKSYLQDPSNPTVLYPWTFKGMKDTHEYARKKFPMVATVREARAKALENRFNIHVPQDDGFAKSSQPDWPLLQNALEFCKEHYPTQRIASEASNASKKDTLLTLSVDLQDEKNAILRQLALSPELLAPVSDYIGSLPILYDAQVWYSPNHQDFDLIGSQFFHFDREDYKKLRIFIPIEEISEECGPLTLVSAKKSEEFMEHRAKQGGDISMKQRFSDEEVAEVVGKDSFISVTGKPGDLAFADVIRCLHFGSRPSKKYKWHIMLHYLPIFSRRLYPHNLKHANRSGYAEESTEDLVMEYLKFSGIPDTKY